MSLHWTADVHWPIPEDQGRVVTVECEPLYCRDEAKILADALEWWLFGGLHQLRRIE